MNKQISLFIVILMTIPALAYGDIASTGYVDSIANTKQDVLPMAARPTNGTYNVVWDSNSGQFIFEPGMQCGSGCYVNGDNVCMYCDKASFNTTQTESVTNGTRSRTNACTSVDVGATTCSCSNRSYGNWTYNCNSGYSGSSSCSCTTPCTSVANRTDTTSGTETCTIRNGTGKRSYTNTCSSNYTSSGCSSAGASCSGCSAYNTRSSTGTCYVQTCNTGYYGTANSSTSCSVCTNKPLHSFYTGSSTSNNCPWTCDSGYTQEGSECGGLSCPSGQYDIGFSQCIDPATNETGYGYINDSVHTWIGPDSSNESVYGLTQDNTWGVTLYTGDKIKGETLCSSMEGIDGKPGNPDEAFDEDTSQYCWCRMTFPAVSRWVFLYDDGFAGNCANNCAGYCGYNIQFNSAFRSGMFGSVE
ncbi:MAG: hypothetical protein KBS86_02380 [Proteobacteria bacterium]|nr:hypothetical protein [Candidatus Enterousia scatequi]